MKIRLFPFLTDATIEASVNGDVITINGEEFDLSPLMDGFRLPASAIGSEWFVGSEFVERVNGVINVTLRLPVHWDTKEELRNPAQPMFIDVTSGAVLFPDTAPPQDEPVDIPVIEQQQPAPQKSDANAIIEEIQGGLK